MTLLLTIRGDRTCFGNPRLIDALHRPVVGLDQSGHRNLGTATACPSMPIRSLTSAAISTSSFLDRARSDSFAHP